eukprot:6192963-Pleurochrysis_carterae.AAC.3
MHAQAMHASSFCVTNASGLSTRKTSSFANRSDAQTAGDSQSTLTPGSGRNMQRSEAAQAVKKNCQRQHIRRISSYVLGAFELQ